MGEDRLNASGFEFYEGIRIAIPGAFALAFYAGIVSTFHLHAPNPIDSALLGLVLAVAVGLVLYFVDLPGQSRIYLAAQPHRILEDWSEQPPSGVSPANVYFVVLDTLVPSGIRSRALYFGSIFRIGFEAILLAAITSIAALAVAALGDPAPLRDTDTTVLWLAIPCHIAAAGLGVREGYVLARKRKDSAADAIREVGRRLAQQVGWTGLIALLLALCALLVFLNGCDSPVLGTAAVVLPGALWIARYQNGYRRASSQSRRNIDAPTGALVLSGTVISATLIAVLTLPAESPIGTAAALGWSGLALIAEILVARRGHEKRLWAAYHTQRAWLTLNKDKVVAEGRLTSTTTN